MKFDNCPRCNESLSSSNIKLHINITSKKTIMCPCGMSFHLDKKEIIQDIIILNCGKTLHWMIDFNKTTFINVWMEDGIAKSKYLTIKCLLPFDIDLDDVVNKMNKLQLLQ